jgi:tetratricopeptide (TPR) repeat protein
MEAKKVHGSLGPNTAATGRLVRLIGWKAIGQYMGCTARTARRWESSRALPVHRIPGGGRGAVCAAPEELKAWLEAQPPKTLAAVDAEDATDAELETAEDIAESSVNGTALSSLGGIAPPMAGPPTPGSADVLTPLPATAPAGGSFRQKFVLLAIACAAVCVAGLAIWKHGRGSDPHVAAAAQSTPYDDDAAARALYLDARFEWSTRSEASLQVAKRKFAELTEQFPSRAAAWCGLADTYLLLREFGSLPQDDAFAKAETAAQRALALDPNLADGWLDSAFIHFWWKNDPKTAFAEFASALKLDPKSAKGYHWYATALQAYGRNVEALAAFARARSLDPGNRAIVADEGWALFAAGRRSAGLGQLERLAAIDPGFVDAHEWLARAYLLEARNEDFLRESTAAATLRNQQARLEQLAAAADRLRIGGRAAMLAQLAENAEREWRNAGASAMNPAVYCALAGDRVCTTNWLEIARATHDHELYMALNYPAFEDYQKDPTYQRVIAQLR